MTSKIELVAGNDVFPSVGLIADLYARIFPELAVPDYVESRFPRMTEPCLHLVSERGSPLGFKLGYRLDGETLYSWLGGIIPNARRRGLAARMMAAQHEWAREQGYLQVETHTRENNQSMLALNRKFGFTATGIKSASHGNMVVQTLDLRNLA